MKCIVSFILLSIIFIVKDGTCFAQNKYIDSLIIVIKNDQPDTNKVNHLISLSNIFNHFERHDTALQCSNLALQLAQQLNFKKGIAESYRSLATVQNYLNNTSEALSSHLKAKKIFEEINDKKQISSSYLAIGNIYLDQGDVLQSLKNMFAALKISLDIKDKKLTSSLYTNISAVYVSQDNYPEALNYIFKALKLKEELGDQKGMATMYSNAGAIYSSQKNDSAALKNYMLSLEIRKKTGDRKGLATSYNNIGLIYYEQGNYSEALKKFFIAIEYGVGFNELIVAEASNNIGSIYIQQNNYAEGQKFISQALSIYKKRDYKYGIATCLVTLGRAHIKMNNLKSAKNYLNQALLFSREIGSKYYIQSSYNGLATIDSIQHDWKAAYEHHKLFVIYRDSINNEESDKKITEITLTNRFEKQQDKLKAENEKQQAIAAEKTRKQKTVSWSIAGGLLLVLVFSGFILRSLRITRKQKSVIELQKNEVSKQKEIADSQRIIAEELREIAVKQKHIVEEKQKEIVDSITYAKRIQTALLTSDSYIKEHLPAEHFILFKPKDIVSGDFYWALSIPFLPGWDMGTNKVKLPTDHTRHNTFYLATADCTGHGVPGAFMSMLNISYLNENVIERGIRLPHDILNAQRTEIINALNPEGSTEVSKDGMDCILCVYDFDKMLLHFAAANNPLWLVRNNELIEYKADKMPVGKYSENTTSFALQTIELQKGDTVYTTTDGFADQFGVNGKKLMKKKFKEELLKIHLQPMAEQKQHLDSFFEAWRGNTEQVDDVCVIGVRI
ncbi:MAG: tetratricopeptide repeat protein [Bacteroidota bacterium]